MQESASDRQEDGSRHTDEDGAGAPSQASRAAPARAPLGPPPRASMRPPHRHAASRSRTYRVHSQRRQGLARLIALLALLAAVAAVGVVVIVAVRHFSRSNPPVHHFVPIKTTNVTIIPGQTRRKVSALLKQQGVRGSYWQDTRTSPLLNPATYGAPATVHSLEGFLFPDTFNLRVPISIPALVADQLKDFKLRFQSVNLSYARQHHFTPYDVLIIASMVEGEAATARDRALVASVIYNRLRIGMPLQIDATTRYATGNYTRPLTPSQINSPSPYNTRNHAGLPPTPIDSPALASIQAAAHPAQTNYLYFVVKPCGNGAMVFSSNYQQFLANQAQYQQARASLGRSPTHC